MERLLRAITLTIFVLALLPGTASADGMVVSICGTETFRGNQSELFDCDLIDGGRVQYRAFASAGRNRFRNGLQIDFEVPTGISNQVNITVFSFPEFTSDRDVPTVVRIDGRVALFEPNASAFIAHEGLLGGAPIYAQREFTVPANKRGTVSESKPYIISFSVQEFGFQLPSDLAADTLTVSLTGHAGYTSRSSPIFVGAVPEPTTMLLLGTGLAGVGAMVRKRRKADKNEKE